MSELWCTLGPASLGKEAELLAAGATGFRFTFSFGTPALQHQRAKATRMAAKSENRSCVNVADIPGGKYRLGILTPPSHRLFAQDAIELYVGDADSSPDGRRLPVTSRRFFSQLHVGCRVTVGDGACILRIVSTSDCSAEAEVEVDGTIEQTRGLTIEGFGQPESLTELDWECIRSIVTEDCYDVLAISFVNSPDDVIRVRALVDERGANLKILAKIETAEGVDRVDAICEVADYIMAARGDLMLSMPWVELPTAVERIAHAAQRASKPWFLATQVMEGLERFALPTRAEVCDLAHWMHEGCSGVLLSYETAFGPRPTTAVKCVRTMADRWNAPSTPAQQKIATPATSSESS
jgi:pyruvate kinase